jgi:hypothetical protein
MKVMLQFKKTASANLPYLKKNEEYDPNYLQKNESTSRKYLHAFKKRLKKIAQSS